MSQTPLKLGGKVALITGGSSGIGAATAKLFTQLGASVSIIGLDKSSLESTVNECQTLNVGQMKPLMVVGNIKDNDVRKKIIHDTVNTFGKLDTLVNNAGIYCFSRLLDEGSIADYDEVLDVNLRSLIVLTQIASPHLIKTKGSVVNTSSVFGHVANFGNIFYGLSKAALLQFTKHAAREFGPHQVRVNSVSPGMINTAFSTAAGLNPDEITQVFNTYAKAHALGRIGEACEVAQAIAFLASDDASFITGADIFVDGGMLVNPVIQPHKPVTRK